jgi:DNA repair exonuclease SbcCD ATPase subunit
MIRQLRNYGFKDQMRTVQFSGLDLITSNDVNGVGKSAVLEAFKLALTGEVPGRAKNVEDILHFSSGDEMSVEILADTPRGSVVVERRFLRQAPRGEKRPVRIDQVSRKYEEGSEWIRQHIGAVSLSFDPFEFLNLSDARKRQWIIAHSPESLEFSQSGLNLLLLARMVEKYLGSGIVHSLLLSLGVVSLDEFIWGGDKACLSSLQDRLIEVFQRQEPERSELTSKTLASAFRFWSASESSEKNSNAMLAHMKSEVLRLKNAVRQQTAALSCMGPASNHDVAEHSHKMSGCREEIQRLHGKIADVKERLRHMRIQAEEKIKREERIGFLQQNIARLAGKLNGEMGEALTEMRDQLQKKRVDSEAIQEKRNRLNRDLTRWSGDLPANSLRDGYESLPRNTWPGD